MNTCPDCDADVEPDQPFCQECGTAIEWEVDADEQPSYINPTWTVAGVLLFVGVILGLIGGLSISGGGQEKIAELQSELDSITAERDALESKLDPIIRAEEAAATAAGIRAAAVERARVEAEVNARAEAEAAAEQAAAKEAANTITDGTYLVNVDIQPGTYRGTPTSDNGYWARLRNTAGELSGIIANGNESGPFVLTIKSSDNAVELQRIKLVKM